MKKVECVGVMNEMVKSGGKIVNELYQQHGKRSCRRSRTQTMLVPLREAIGSVGDSRATGGYTLVAAGQVYGGSVTDSAKLITEPFTGENQ